MMVFFDIDGTLIDQRRAEAAAAAGFLRDHAERIPQPCDIQELCRRWRALREKHAPAYFQGTIAYEEYHRRRVRELFIDGAALTDAECDARFGAFLEEYRAAWTLFDDVLPCLDALAGLPLGILSNGNAAQQRDKLARTGILDRFAVVIISEEVGFAKPDRGIFHEACRRAHFYAGAHADPHAVPHTNGDGRCWHLGDRLDSDARGGCAAGVRGIWLDRCGGESRGGEARCGESPLDVEVVHSLTHLPSWLHAPAAPRLHAPQSHAATVGPR